MDLDLKPFFEQYEAFVRMADEAFERVKNEFPDCVTCKQGCSDCCHALFDLTFIEALYLNEKFNEKFKGAEKEALLERANRADRETYKIKKNAYKALDSGKTEDEIIANISKERVRCALLNDEDTCDMYEFRPVTCRLYGVPTSIGNAGHTCGLSGFSEGTEYPTINLDVLHRQFYKLSAELVSRLNTRFVKMADMMVPLSMALITVYDDEYLGIKGTEKGEENEGNSQGNEK